MADQQFCLRWNNHQSTLISVFDTLLENGTLVDCTLAAEGQYLKAHKVVLCACSPYLEALLSQHYEKHPIVILKDVKFSELKSMMDYMYRGEVNISQDQLGTFLKAAESLQIKGLSDNGADGDARDVGSTPKAPPPRKPNVPAPSSRSEPARPDSPLTDGSMSPSSRKRRRVRRSSQDEDSHIENNCDLPSQAQSTPVPNIPAATSSITTTPIVKPAIVKPEQTEINRVDTNSLPADVLKKEIEPISEPLLEPKTEYLEDVNNEDSVEDLTLDDDDDMDGMDISNMSNMSNMSRPGPSHGNDISNQGFAAWNLGANQSGTDEVFMAAQEAVNQHRDSQDDAKKKSLDIDPLGEENLGTHIRDLAELDLNSLKEEHFEMDYLNSDLDNSYEKSPNEESTEIPTKDLSEENTQSNDEIANENAITVKGSFSHESLPIKPSINIHCVDGQASIRNLSISDQFPPSETLPGSRENTCIYHDGRGYYYDGEKNTKTRRLLRCIHRRKKPKCQARAAMLLKEGSPIFSLKRSPHNHPPDLELREQKLGIHMFKQRVRSEPDKSIDEILKEETEKNNVERIVKNPRDLLNLRRGLLRERRNMLRKHEGPPEEELVDFEWIV
ncbi:sex determination protein fruitless-like isoform X4 [Macrosteles quadrilineatus]|uniref:sex determination protein fruitless-like isoform X4 n=1 Tax=Macrosteles quadrilineatus TaxID=74068 RepID=UPI0023E0A2A9|nr:sex determination protein fruitless-like isoform X4 [Macrosteles quadrilineatus]